MACGQNYFFGDRVGRNDVREASYKMMRVLVLITLQNHPHNYILKMC